MDGFAFEGCTGLTSVTISEGVNSIGDNAFQGCTGLIGITIPASVTGIRGSAFSYCSGLVNVSFGGANTTIGGEAFPYSTTGGTDTLKTLYEANGEGTYTRTKGADDWTKQP